MSSTATPVRSHGKPIVLWALLIATFAISVDTTIVNVALPSLVRQLHASNSQLQWVVDAFNLLFAASVLVAGSLSDRLGRKGMLLLGLAVFGLSSLVGALMSTPTELIVARAVMGVGAAMVFPATLSLLTNVFTTRQERALAIGLWGATTGAAIALGPIVGGALLQASDWRSVFFAMAPVAALAMALVARAVPTSRDPRAASADIAGFALSTATIGLLVYTIIEAPDHGWGSARTLVGFAASAVLVVAFALAELRSARPMLDVSLFRNPRFTAASASVAISFFSLSGFIFLVTQYAQFLKQWGALSTGVRMLPVASFVAISSIVGTKLAVRFGTKLIVAAGLALMAGFYLWVSSADATTSYLTIALQMVVLGTGMGLTSSPATEAIMGVLPAEQAGVGSAVNDATRLLGGTLGVAIMGSVYGSLFTSRLAAALPRGLPGAITHTAHSSVGAALTVAQRVALTGHPRLAGAIHEAASRAFFSGFHAADYVAAGVAVAGVAMALGLLPAHPTAPTRLGPPADQSEPLVADEPDAIPVLALDQVPLTAGGSPNRPLGHQLTSTKESQ